MPVADNQPDRRNLLVTSLCFVTYFLAGGEFTDNSVRLQVINVEFGSPKTLVLLAWIMLFWFALRYWQVNQGKILKSFEEEMSGQALSILTILYAKHYIKKKYREVGGFSIHKIHKNGGVLLINYGDVFGGEKNEVGILVNFRSNNRRDLKIEGFLGVILKISLGIKLAVIKPGFGNYMVPYILFIFAILLGVKSTLL